jgi:hypothetical protein
VDRADKVGRPARRVPRLTAGLGAAALALALGASAVGASAPNGMAHAKQGLLVQSDFPSGWHAQGSVTTSMGGGNGSFPGAQQLATCLGVSPAILDLNAPSATSPTFESTVANDYAQDQVSAFATTKVARQEYAGLANPKVPGCMTTDLQGPAGKQLLGSIGKGATVGTITVTSTNPAWLVPHTTGFTISFPVTTQGVTLNSSITVVSMVRGRYGSQLSLTSVGSPFPASLARHLVAVAYSRT